jgi:ABC-2 type transport system permease protein
MTTIYILWLRQIKRYFRSPSRIVGSLGQPLLFMFALGFGLGPIFQRAGSGNYLNFLAPGVMAQGILFTSIFSGIELIMDRQFGFLKEILVAPVSRLQIMFGRTLGGATIAIFQGIVVFFLALLLGFRPINWLMLPVAVVIMFLIAILFTALGTAIASPMQDMHGFQLVMNFLVMPLYFLSGSLFPLQSAPKFLTTISRFNPFSYGVDGLREVLVGMTNFGLSTDIIVLVILASLALILGSYLFSRLQA